MDVHPGVELEIFAELRNKGFHSRRVVTPQNSHDAGRADLAGRRTAERRGGNAQRPFALELIAACGGTRDPVSFVREKYIHPPVIVG
jgi:hypothetical protein